jgi:hypothetical protein
VFNHDVGPITLTGAGGGSRTALMIERSSQHYSFDDLEPGSYSVQIDDPRFLPWRKDGVAPGTRVSARLEGSSAVQLAVVDAQSGEPVPRFALDVRFDDANFRPNVFRVLEEAKDPPDGGVFRGLIPRDQTLVVSAQGYAPCEVAVPGLAPQETRAVVARLSRGATLACVVRWAGTGAPAPAVQVRATPKRDTKAARVYASDEAKNALSSRTDASGRALVAAVRAGTWVVEAFASPLLRVEREITVAGEGNQDVILELPAAAWLAGRVIGPEGASYDGLALVAMPIGQERSPARAWRMSRDAAVGLAADGSFRTPELPAGKANVSLRLPDAHVPTSFSGSAGLSGGQIDLGQIDLPPGETRCDFDLRENFPGAIEVVARLNGALAAGVVVQATSVDPPGRTGAAVLERAGPRHAAAARAGDVRLARARGRAELDLRRCARPTRDVRRTADREPRRANRGRHAEAGGRGLACAAGELRRVDRRGGRGMAGDHGGGGRRRLAAPHADAGSLQAVAPDRPGRRPRWSDLRLDPPRSGARDGRPRTVNAAAPGCCLRCKAP